MMCAGAEVRERDEKGKVWCWPEGGSTDFEDEDEEEEGAASGEGAAAARRSGQQRRRISRQAMDTQPFPADALAAARRGAEQMSGRAAALRGDSAAAAAPSTAKPSSAGGSKSGGSGSGGESSTALHVYPYGLDGAAIADVAESLGLGGGLVVAQRIQDADTVLALRGKINSSEWGGCAAGGEGGGLCGEVGSGQPCCIVWRQGLEAGRRKAEGGRVCRAAIWRLRWLLFTLRVSGLERQPVVQFGSITRNSDAQLGWCTSPSRKRLPLMLKTAERGRAGEQGPRH
jgi:hypothetical protein